MPAAYSLLPNPSSNVRDPERELADAFELNDEDDLDSPVDDEKDLPHNRPSPQQQQETSVHVRRSSLPPAYDFERQDYDFPPPGSPPRPTDRALPNNYGNSNGFLPEAPVLPQPNQASGSSFFRRAAGAIFPSRYQRVASSEHPQRVVGGGTDNDGVFANVMAKPQIGRVETAEDGSVYVMPETVQKEMPPTYAEAQADAVPPYWETTVHAPASLDPNSDLIIEDLPTGSFMVFALNMIFSFFFKFVGFFLTYLLHTTHAAKYGSRAGLGLTLIQYGFLSRMVAQQQEPMPSHWTGYANATAQGESADNDPDDMAGDSGPSDWLSFLFMTIGWFLLLSSCVGYWRIKRWERSIRAPPTQEPTPEDLQRDQAARMNIAQIFGFAPIPETAATPESLAAEARLQADLQRAGLL